MQWFIIKTLVWLEASAATVLLTGESGAFFFSIFSYSGYSKVFLASGARQCHLPTLPEELAVWSSATRLLSLKFRGHVSTVHAQTEEQRTSMHAPTTPPPHH